VASDPSVVALSDHNDAQRGQFGPESAHGGGVELVGLAKSFGDFVALEATDLEIRPGEFFSLLGPSGCGKTTTLRLIAGFEQPTAGRILLDGADVAPVPSHKRPVNTVFQSYALFPHLNVRDNVAYGLRWLRNVPKAERIARVDAAIALVQLEAFTHRKPAQLSGGQQQRVALARALVLRPKVLLLDEPLGALDAKLRKALQVELSILQRDVGITFVYVTHDQEEALTMSDRLAVMDRGKVAQVGTPREVYEQPCNAYVADFLGVANLIEVESLGNGSVRCGEGVLVCGAGAAPAGDARVVVRPERVRLGAYGLDGPNRLSGLVDRLVYLGPTTQVVVRLSHGATVHALVTNADGALDLAPGTAVSVEIPADGLRLLPTDDGVLDLTAEERAEFTLSDA
jgi:spermidine/putrescine transport system ATP-binding protein